MDNKLYAITIKIGRSRAAGMSFVEFLCAASIASTSKEARKLLKSGQICVNGKTVKDNNFSFSALESFDLTVGRELSYKVRII